MTTPAPVPPQLLLLQGEITTLGAAKQLMVFIQQNWTPPGPNTIPQTVAELNQIIALSQGIGAIANQLLQSGGTSGSPIG